MPASMQTLVGIFKDYATARTVAEELISEGFSASEVHVTSGEPETKAFGARSSQPIETEHHEGGISGWFHRVFGDSDVSDEERGGYQQAIKSGQAAVAVDVDDNRADRVIDIMEEHGSIDIDHQKRSNSSGVAVVGASAAENVIPVVDEQLQVGKRTVQSGGVRVVSRIVSRPVEEDLQLREEKVSVNRRPVDRAATEADFRTGENAFEMRETREEAVVGKTARVVEEVVVGKQTTERTETVRDTLRRTEVEVEDIDPTVKADFQRDYDTRFGTQPAGSYDEYAPAYEYGYRTAGSPQYSGKSWDAVEDDVRDEYSQTNPSGKWDRTKDAVRYGWNKVAQKV